MRALKLIIAALATAMAALALAAGPASAQAPASCADPDNLTHCEQVVDTPGCNPTSAYLRYPQPPGSDTFVEPYGPAAVPGEYINVRNATYRRYGPRGVRVFRSGTWLFMSGNCLTGGL